MRESSERAQRGQRIQDGHRATPRGAGRKWHTQSVGVCGGIGQRGRVRDDAYRPALCTRTENGSLGAAQYLDVVHIEHQGNGVGYGRGTVAGLDRGIVNIERCGIGTRCRNVPVERAHEVVAGYLVVNDVSVRDWQRATPTMTMGKSWDTHGPIGPWLVTADEVADPHNLRLRTWVDDEVRQDASTSQMITNCWQQIAHLSTAFTLLPGTIIATGTPEGVGMAMKPPRCLKVGSRVRIEIEGIGTIDNPVVAQATE